MNALFIAWHRFGVFMGWIGPAECETHLGLPLTPTEQAEFEDGSDPCIYALRLFHSRADQKAALHR
jgi:hypothetical protein